MSDSGPPADPGGITVAGLAASGGALLQGVRVPDPQARVTDVEIYDAATRQGLVAGSLLLGVGLDPLSEATARVLAEAAEVGVTAVALVGTPGEVGAAAASAAAHPALFAVPPGAAWARVHSVARTLTTTSSAARELATPYQDLFAVANAIAANAGGPATIEDAESRLLAFSNPQEPVDARRLETILGRATPDRYARDMRQAGVFRRLAESTEPVLLNADPEQGLRARLAMAIKAGEEVLGYLWVSEGTRPLGAEATRALKKLAPVVALHLLRVIAAGSADRNRRRDLVSAALDGTWSADLALELGVRRGERLIVACLAPDDDGHADTAHVSERACQIIELHFSTYRVRGAATRRGERIYCLLPSGGAESAAYQRVLIGELLDSLTTSLHATFRVGIGEAAPAHALPRCRVEAEMALRTGRLLGLDPRTAHIVDVRDRALLVALRDLPELQSFLDRGSIARIRAYDHAHGTAYLPSLRVYLNCHCNIPAAARALHVHANTLRYRLGKVAELFAIDLDDHHVRLALSLQMWLMPPDAPGKDADERWTTAGGAGDMDRGDE